MDSVNQKYYEIFEGLECEYDEYFELLCSVEIMSDNKLYVHYQNKKKVIEEIVKLFKKYKNLTQELQSVKELFELEESESLKSELQKTINELEQTSSDVFESVKKLYFERGSKVNQVSKIEISFKSGEKEFVSELETMFQNFSNANNFKCDQLVNNETSVSLQIEGENVFDILKSFGGTIKKIIKTNESTALVVVLLDSNQEFEFNENDVEIQISKSSGAGGQHINKTESAVKLIHLPTGITAECQDERSQGKNKEKAMEALKLKILQKLRENQENSIKNQRKSLKNAIFSDTPILIFDFDRNKIVDNRTKKNYEIDDIIQGNLKLIAGDLRV